MQPIAVLENPTYFNGSGGVCFLGQQLFQLEFVEAHVTCLGIASILDLVFSRCYRELSAEEGAEDW
jgi:hypothetical protein